MHAVVKMPVDTLRPVPPDEVMRIWPDVVGYIEEANKYGGGEFTVTDWLVKILSGYADLLVHPGKNAAAVCEVQQYPRRRIYAAILCGGEGEIDWLQLQAAIESAAKSHGCNGIELVGRKGWRRRVEGFGYSFAHWVWRKEV